jgi:hypothetical protein
MAESSMNGAVLLLPGPRQVPYEEALTMPIPAPPLRVGDRGDAVARLRRTLEAIKRAVDAKERDVRVFGGATEVVLRNLQEQSAIP